MDTLATAMHAVGPYTHLTLHARGGLGEVLKATDGDLNRTVAVKRLQDRNADDADNRRRFRLEAEITARLEHPGVVPVYGLLKDDADRPSYAMRFIEGQTLAEAIAEYHKAQPDALAFRRLLQCFLHVCNTVAYAHSRGVIHRDLKPANVMLGKFGETLVVDWGLAKVVDRPDEIRAVSTETTLQTAEATLGEDTALGSAVGTPAFMSPEQAAGRWDIVSTTSDIYSLGAVLYILLTGRPPLLKGNWPELLQKIQRGDFPRPRQISTRVPHALEAICMKAMALEPGDRYGSVQSLAADVERWLGSEPVGAWREPLWARGCRWMRRHKTLMSGAAMLLVTGLIAAAASLFLLDRKNHEIAAERNAARAAADEAQAINTFLTEDLLGQADPDVNDRAKKITVEELLHRAARKIEGNPKFTQHPELEGNLRLVLGKTFFKLGDLVEAEKHLRLAMSLHRQALAADEVRTLAAQEALADFWNRGPERSLEAEILARQTWQARARILGAEHRDTLDSLDTYCTSLLQCERFDEAESLFRECLASRRRTLGPAHVDTVVSMNNLGYALLDQGKWAEARAVLRESMDISSRCGTNSNHNMNVLNLSVALYMEGELDEAERILNEQRQRCARQFGAEHPVTNRLDGLRCRVWADQGRLTEAAALSREVVKRRLQIYAQEHRLTAHAQLELGRILVLSGQHREAHEALTRAQGVFATIAPRPKFYHAWLDGWRGAALAGMGRSREAEPILIAAEQALRGRPELPPRHYREIAEQLALLREAWNED